MNATSTSHRLGCPAGCPLDHHECGVGEPIPTPKRTCGWDCFHAAATPLDPDALIRPCSCGIAEGWPNLRKAS